MALAALALISPGMGAEGAQAKNVILMIGDGMGYAQMTAARMEKAEGNLSMYMDTRLYMDDMEYGGHSSTHAADSFITDSAAAVTALATGQKTDIGVINQDASAVKGQKDGENLTTIQQLAEGAGKSTGVVSTTRITHATPAGFYAHVNDRDAEDLIAEQPIGSGLEVALGGGLRHFLAQNEADISGVKSSRKDDRNLLKEASSLGYAVIINRSGFDRVNGSSTEGLLGLFDESHMLYERQRINQSEPEPSLAEMTEKAIEILSQDPEGFFLMVEGGRIDHAGHERSYDNITADTLAFDEAVKVALDYANQSGETLVIVTADHECGGLVLSALDYENYSEGYNPIFGSGVTRTPGPRYDFMGEVEATHTCVDVPLLASGPTSERFSHGLIDNTKIFSLMEGAMGL